MSNAPLIFISHSSLDENLAANLCTELQARGISTWIAGRDVPVGGDHAHESTLAISQCDGVAVILSLGAMQSGFVRREVEFAVSNRVPVYPIQAGVRAFTVPYAWDLLLVSLQVLTVSSMGDAARSIASRVRRS